MIMHLALPQEPKDCQIRVMLKHYGETIASIRDHLGLTQEDVAAKSGLSVRMVAKAEGTAHPFAKKKLRMSSYMGIASALGLSKRQMDDAWGYNSESLGKSVIDRVTDERGRPYTSPDVDASRRDRHDIGITIPFHTQTSAGRGIDYQLGVMADKFLPSSLLPHPEWGPGAFVVAGDSMSPYFNPGDILIIAERLQDVRTNDILIVCMKTGEHTVKKLRIINENTWQLVPINPAHEATTIHRDEIDWYVPVMVRIEPIYTRRQIPWDEDA